MTVGKFQPATVEQNLMQSLMSNRTLHVIKL